MAGPVEQADGTVALWTARPDSAVEASLLAMTMAAARAEEYRPVQDSADQAGPAAASSAVVKKLRAKLRRIEGRDYSPPPERAAARVAVAALAERLNPRQPGAGIR